MANSSLLLLRPSALGLHSSFRSELTEGFLQCRTNGASLCCSRRMQRRMCSPEQSLSLTTLHSGSRTNSRLIRCRTAGGGEVPPESREEAIAQAARSVSSLLEKNLKRQGPTTVKQRKQQQQMKLRVEIPVLDESPTSLVSLSLDFLSSLFTETQKPPGVAVFFTDASSGALAREQFGKNPNPNPNPNQSVHELSSEIDVAGTVSVVVVAGARCADTARLQELARNVRPRPIVVLNPEWTSEDESDPAWGAFLSSFETAYTFLPLAIQGFLSKTEGAVLKNVQSGAPAGRPWLIFVKENGKYTRLASLQRRPGPAELESALYNAMAANSPVTKSIKFFRGLVSKE